MAGDWIKMRLDLQSHPKVVRILSATASDKFRVVGGLHAVWGVFDQHSEDGVLDGYTPDLMDHIIGWQGFAQAMIDVGWLDYDGDNRLTMPEFEAHNGRSGKRRAEDQKRKRESRQRPQSVRNPSAECHTESVTREEKSREESKNPSCSPSLSEGLNAIRSFCTDTGPHEDEASAVHDALEKHLRDSGWVVQREAFVASRGDGRRGRVDLILWCGEEAIAIEIDRQQPRKKSIHKLRNADVAGRVIVLRAESAFQVEGIDAVLSVQVEKLRPESSGTRLPAEWALPTEWRQWAVQHCPSIDPDREAAKFRDYWHAKSGAGATKKDWQATWRNWCRTAEERQGKKPGGGSSWMREAI